MLQCAGGTLCANVLAGRMPHRKHFALPAPQHAFSPNKSMVLLRFGLFTILPKPFRRASVQKSAVEICPCCANYGALASRPKWVIVERKKQFGMLKVKDTL